MPKTDIDGIEGNTMADITIMTATWLLRGGVDAAFDARADLNCDGVVNNIDADILAGNWPVSRENTIHYYYHFDGLGSVAAVSDQNGHVVETYRYSVYGETEIRDSNFEIRVSSLCKNPYMYTGRRLDTETGLYYYRARMYSPNLGRFLQADPIGYRDGINWYRYCRNNPVRYIDSLGLSTTMIKTGDNKQSLYDPTMEEFRKAIDSVPDKSITYLKLSGHGWINTMDIEPGGNSGHGIYYDEGTGGKIWSTDDYESFADYIRPKLADGAEIYLNGCVTAGFYPSSDNIARNLSRELPNQLISGNRGFGLGNDIGGLYAKGNKGSSAFRIGKHSHVIGIKISYVNGRSVLK